LVKVDKFKKPLQITKTALNITYCQTASNPYSVPHKFTSIKSFMVNQKVVVSIKQIEFTILIERVIFSPVKRGGCRSSFFPNIKGSPLWDFGNFFKSP